MTWATTKDQGSGTLSYRLEIHGCTRSFVTHLSMVKPAATPPRIAGLTVSTGKLKAIANVASGELDVSGLSVKLTDLGEGTTGVFGRQPSARTWLTTNLTSSATTMSVRSTAAFASSGSLWLDSEALTYSGITATTFTGLTRGALSTLAQAHYTDSGGSLRFPEVTNLPVTYAGRRAILYVYGENDDPQGNGTQIFRGIISREPTFRGAEWSLSIDPITSVLARAVGADLGEPLSPRGIYYPWNRPFNMTVVKAADGVASPSDGTPVNIRFPMAAGDTAFFENNEAFVTYLNTKIAASAIAAWDTDVIAVADGDDSWHLEATTDATPTAVYVVGPGGIDPVFYLPVDVDGAIVTTFAADTVYKFFGTPDTLPGAGSVPRGYVGQFFHTEGASVGNPALAGTFDSRTFYLGGVASVSSLVTAISFTLPAFAEEPELTVSATATASASPRKVAFNAELPHIYSHGFTAAALPEIRLGRTYATNGSVWTALSGIISAAPAEINAGSVPDLQSGDFDSTSWGYLDLDWQPRIVRERTFVSFSDVPVMDMVREELKLAGYALGLSTTGTLTIFRLRRPVATEAGATTIDAFKVDKSDPTWSPAGVGLVNTVKVKRGWAPIDDDYTAPTAVVRDVAAYGQSPRPRLIGIEPKSVPTDGVETNAEIVEVAARIFGVLAHPYAIVSAEVGLRHFDSTTPGAAVSITSGDLPDTSDGTRGVTSLAGLVTGREVDLGDGRISLTIYVPLDRVSGYAPEAKVTSNNLVSGNEYELTCDTYTFPSGTTASSWFAIGDEVRVFRWDSTTAGTLSGTVTDHAASNVITVNFDGAWTPGSDTWVLAYDTADSPVDSTQLAYVYMADTDGRIDDGGDGLDAWSFA